MKKILLLFSVVTMVTVLQAQNPAKQAEGLVWYTSLPQVHELSKANNKPIFAFFTGSDWCGWCKKLQRDVFAKPEFIQWAQKNVVLLELDFPRGKQLPQELVQQNQSLQQALGVGGYPTVWLIYTTKNDTTNSFNLNTLGSLGYPSGAVPGKEEVLFLQNANAVLAPKKNN